VTIKAKFDSEEMDELKKQLSFKIEGLELSRFDVYLGEKKRSETSSPDEDKDEDDEFDDDDDDNDDDDKT
jgi:hypothetical protein